MTETRAEKAQRLHAEGRVDIQWRGDLYTRAVVQGDHKTHDTYVYGKGSFFCTCDYGTYNMYTDDLCAHALALRLLIEKESKP